MAANFKIHTDTHTEGPRLKLTGDFDGNSALEVVHLLETYAKFSDKIFVDTDGLQHIYEFGKAVFEDACSDLQEIRSGSTQLIFSGNEISLQPTGL
ncbi:MAG: hypothetical protein R6U38_04215 [Desulfatiglandaceae bacterium]